MGIEDFIQLMKLKQGERSLREFARSLKVSPAYISDIYNGNRSPGAAIARPLGYRCEKVRSVVTTFTPLRRTPQ